MREDLDKLLSPKRKRSTRSTSSKKNSVSHQPNSTQSLDNVTSPISSPVGSQKSNYFFGSDSNGDASYETRGSASCTEGNQKHVTRSYIKNMSRMTSVSTTPPSSSSSGYKSRLSLLSMVYQSAGKGRTPCETTQIISPSPESSPDPLKESSVRRCDFEELVSDYVMDPMCCGWNVQLDRVDEFTDQALSSEDTFENNVTVLGPPESSYMKRHHSFTCPGSENLRPQIDDYFSSFEGESDDETKSSVTTFKSRNSRSKFLSSTSNSTLPKNNNQNSYDDRQLCIERDGIDCEGRLSALNMGIGLGKRKSASRSLFSVNDDEIYTESKISSVTEDTSSKSDSYRHRSHCNDENGNITAATTTATATATLESSRGFRLGSILEREGDSPEAPSSSSSSCSSSSFKGVSSSSTNMDTNKNKNRNIIDNNSSNNNNNNNHNNDNSNNNDDSNNGVTERSIGRIGANLVVRGNPFSSSECSSPPAYAYSANSTVERKNVPSVTVEAEPASCWELTAAYNSSHTVRFPYGISSFPTRTPSKSAAEHMGDLGTPVTEAGSPADIDMDGDADGDVVADVSVTVQEKSLLSRVRDNEMEEIMSSRKNRKEKCDGGIISRNLDLGFPAGSTERSRGAGSISKSGGERNRDVMRKGDEGAGVGIRAREGGWDNDNKNDIRCAKGPTGYTVFRSYSDFVLPSEEECTSNISHITADSVGGTSVPRTHNNVSFRQCSSDREREREKEKEVEVRRSRRQGTSESANSLSHLDGLYSSSLGECSLSFSSSSFMGDYSNHTYPYPYQYPQPHHPHRHRSSQGGSNLSGPRPLPDQTAFDGRFPTAKATSPTLVQATPSRVLCPATPMRTPSWAVDRLPEDSDDQRSMKSSTSTGSIAATVSMSTHRATDRGLSLKQNRVLISLSDSISTTDVSFDRDFYHEGLLGVGTSADVYRAREKNGQLYAVKKIKNPFRSKRDRTILMGEVTTMKKLGEIPCKNLVRLIRAWQEDGHFFVQVDLAERGTLRDLLTVSAMNGIALQESTVWHIVHDAAAGLQHIHDCGFVHLDVKPANLLISLDGCLKIGDFGLTVESGKQWDGREGDNGYMAPELLINDYRYPTADVFSLGLTLYEVCIFLDNREAVSSGQSALPSGGDDWHLLRTGQAPKIPSQYSQALMTVIESAMAVKPASRPTTQHLLGLPEVVLAGASGDPVLESAKGILSTEWGSDVGSGPGSGAEFRGHFRFARSASFNPTMAQLLGISIGTGSGIGSSDIMISPCMGGVNVNRDRGFHFSDEELDRDRSRSRDRSMEDTDSIDQPVLADDGIDMTNRENEGDADEVMTGYDDWGDCGQDGSETPDCASTPVGISDFHGSLNSPSQCSRSQLEVGDKEDYEINGDRSKCKSRCRERGRGRERKRERDDVVHLTSNETTSTSTESADEDEDNLIGSGTFF